MSENENTETNKTLKNDLKSINKKQDKKAQKKLKKQEKLIKKEQKKQDKQNKIKQNKITKKLNHNKRVIEQAKLNDWFKLDNAATIYPSIRDDDWSFVFRVSAVLNDSVNCELLQKAVNDTMPRFPTFNVGLKRGIFWNYFEERQTFPKVEQEKNFPCSTFKLFSSTDHIVRVLYYNNRVSVECFHAIADGRSVLKFFNSLLRRYFILQEKEITSSVGCLEILDMPRKDELEDAFFVHSDNSKKLKHKELKAYKLKGTPLEAGEVNAITGTCNAAKIKELAKSYNATVGQFLVAQVAYSIYTLNKNHKKPIKISVPIDLRKFFETKSLRNFSGYINVEIKPKSEEYTLAQIIEIVKKEFERINKDYLKSFINGNVSMQKNYFIKIVPLFLKNLIIKLCFKAWGEAYQTINISNLGVVDVPSEFADLVDKYIVNLGRPKYNAKTIGVATYNNKLTITFSSKIKENLLEEHFFKSLTDNGVDCLIETNRRDIYG